MCMLFYIICLLSAHHKSSNCKIPESDSELSVITATEECKQINNITLLLEKLLLFLLPAVCSTYSLLCWVAIELMH